MPGPNDPNSFAGGGMPTTQPLPKPQQGAPQFQLDPIRNHPDLIPTDAFYVDAQGNVVQKPSPEQSQLDDLLAAQEAERAAREARIAAALDTINRIFGNRAGVFDEYADTTFDLNRERLGDQRSDTAQQLKFALARAGTLGGSADVDRHAELDERYNESLTDARSFADDRAARLRADEEAAKSALFGVASSGNVTGAQAGSLAQGALGASQSALEAPATMPNLGQNFSGIADVIGQALIAQGLRQGRGQGVPGFGNEFSSFFPGRGNQREEGTIS